MKEIGELLKQRRESLNVTLEEVSSVTKINVKSLQALEAGELDKLPAKTFVRGFVQTYAKYLGLNSQEILDKLQTTLGSTRPKPAESNHPSDQATTMRKPVNTDFSGSGKNIITAGAIILTIIAIAIIQRIVSRHEAEMKTTEVQAITGNDQPVNVKPAPTPAPVPTPAAAPTASPMASVAATPSPTPTVKPTPRPKKSPTPAASAAPTATGGGAAAAAPVVPAEEPQEIIVEALDNVVIKVSIDGKGAQEISMAPDQIQTFKAKGRIKLVTPNGGAINITHNGKEIGVPGNLGQPKTMVFPQ